MNIEQAVNVEDVRSLARRHLPRIVFDYIDGGAESEAGIARNRAAFEALQLLPRYLVDVSQRSQEVALLGRRYASPFGIGPTGLAGFARPKADLMLAQAAAQANIPFVLSGAATASIEAVAKLAPHHLWFQLYVARQASITADLLRRARDAGVETLVLTVDAPVHSRRERDIRNGFALPVKPTWSARADMLMHPRWLLDLLTGGLPRFETWAPYAPDHASVKALADFFSSQIPFTQTWHELDALRRLWPGKLVVKGILHPLDAKQAVQVGVDGLIVSNHGGRVLDAAPSPLDVLALIRQAVDPKTVLMLDSGIRRGADVLKACALGAGFVFVGRATLYGVAASGQRGAQRVIDMLRQELDVTMAQVGCTRLEDSRDIAWGSNLREQGLAH